MYTSVMERLELKVHSLYRLKNLGVFDSIGVKIPKTQQYLLGCWSRVMVAMHSVYRMNPCTTLEGLFACTKCNGPVYNAIQDYTRHMSAPSENYMKSLKQLTKYILCTQIKD